MDGWNTIFPMGVPAYFQGRLLLVSGRVTAHDPSLVEWLSMKSFLKVGRIFGGSTTDTAGINCITYT